MEQWGLLITTIASAIVLALAYFGWRLYRIPHILKLEQQAVQRMAAGELDKSEQISRKALSLAEAHWDEANTAPILLNLAETLRIQERWEESEQSAQRALEYFRKSHGLTSTMVALTLKTLSEVSAGMKDYHATDSYLRELTQALQQEETHPELGNSELRDSLKEGAGKFKSTHGVFPESPIELRAAFTAHALEDYEAALAMLLPIAESENADAQYKLGVMYTNGQGVEQDYAEALKWLYKAADQGHAVAQNNIGLLFQSGLGVSQSYTEAFKWLSKAAEQGAAIAQNNLAAAYFDGMGVKQDQAKAVELTHLAADQGFAQAQFGLGVMYMHGIGVEQDSTEGVRWHREAAEQGLGESQEALGCLYFNGEGGVTQDLSEALKWSGIAAEQGFADAQAQLGVMYTNGYGVQQDHVEAANWFRLAAEQGNHFGQYDLGILYVNGDGVEQDYVEAAKWFRLAAEQGNIFAQNSMGVIHEEGQGIPPDMVEAYAWYVLASANGLPMTGQSNEIKLQLLTKEQQVEAKARADELLRMYGPN
jgi:TPR repeat protein